MLDPWMGPTLDAPRPWVGDLVVMARRIRLDADVVAEALAGASTTLSETPLDLGEEGRLQLLTPFSSVEHSETSWNARARLHGHRHRLHRSTSVHITISTWSSDACELWLRPTARAPQIWGIRRLRRYLTLANLAADELERRLGSWSRPHLATASSQAAAPEGSLSTAA